MPNLELRNKLIIWIPVVVVVVVVVVV